MVELWLRVVAMLYHRYDLVSILKETKPYRIVLILSVDVHHVGQGKRDVTTRIR